jgi:hypothetical protein
VSVAEIGQQRGRDERVGAQRGAERVVVAGRGGPNVLDDQRGHVATCVGNCEARRSGEPEQDGREDGRRPAMRALHVTQHAPGPAAVSVAALPVTWPHCAR